MGTHRIRGSQTIVFCALALLVLLAVLALAACGGKTVSGATPFASLSPTASSPPAAPSDGTKMAASYESPPFSPTDAVGTPTVGWVFRPKVDIKLTELGCYDADQEGLKHTHRVGIFDARTDRLLASVKAGPGSELEGAFRWEPLARPLILKAGHPYAVGTASESTKAGRETMYEEGTEQWAQEIHFGGLRTTLGGSAFSAPTNRKLYFAMGKVAWMSPNFKFVPVSAQ